MGHDDKDDALSSAGTQLLPIETQSFSKLGFVRVEARDTAVMLLAVVLKRDF
jgi:hypothetical protein